MSSHLLVQSLTAVRVPLAIAFAVVLLSSTADSTRVLVCLTLLVLQEVSDALDGALARRLGLVSRWGQMFDPFADSVSRLIVYWALAGAGLALAVVPLVMALRDITVAYSRLVAADHGGSVSARLSGKIKACVQGIAALYLTASPLPAVSGLVPWNSVSPAIVSWIVILVTAGSAVEYVYSAITAATSSCKSSPWGEPVHQLTTNSTVNDAASAMAAGSTPGAEASPRNAGK